MDVRYPLVFCQLCVLESGWQTKEITTTTLLQA